MKKQLYNIFIGLLFSVGTAVPVAAQITGGGGAGGNPSPTQTTSKNDHNYDEFHIQVKFGSETYYGETLYGLNLGGSISIFQTGAFILGGRIEANNYFASDFEPFELNLDLGVMAVWDIGNGMFLEGGPILVPSLFDEYEETILKTGFAARFRFKNLLLSFEQMGGTYPDSDYGGIDTPFTETFFGIGFSF